MTVLAPSPAAAPTAFDAVVQVDHVRYARQDGTWAVVHATAGAHALVVVGPLGHLRAGDRARVRGEWRQHGTFGRQVEAVTADPVDPSDDVGRIRLLEALPDVGAALARQLVAAHGALLFDVLDRDPIGTFSALPRFNAAKAAAAAGEWARRRADRELYVLLASQGLGRLVGPLVDRYGVRALAHVQGNPYVLIAERGVAFATADRIAEHVGIRGHDPRRVEAVVVHVLREAEEAGHTFLTTEELAHAAARYVGPVGAVPLAAALLGRQIVCDDDRVALAATRHAEVSAARRVVDLVRAGLPPTADLPQTPPAPFQQLSSDEQWLAVRRAFGCGVSVIVGGPGVGKTSTVRALVAVAADAGLSVALCAPAGRAARRLEQATGHVAVTMHALLEWGQGDLDGPQRNRFRPLDEDVIVVDEASMADTHLTWALLDATPTGRRVVFVGDPDQLPSVGAGKVLSDLIVSGVVPVTRLTRVFRQARHSMIIRGAHAINAGRAPSFDPSDEPESRRDLFLVAEADDTRIPGVVGDLVAERLPRWSDIDPLVDIAVVAPSKRGNAGVDALNSHLAGRLNPDGKRLQRLPHLSVGDKVMWTRNDRELGLMNGTILFIQHEDRNGAQILCLDEDQRLVAIPWDKAGSLRAAYALTVHKAQGCEVPVVVVVMHRRVPHASLLCRSLLYTAVTRARDTVVIVGEYEALAAAVKDERTLTRNTTLLGRLMREASERSPRALHA